MENIRARFIARGRRPPLQTGFVAALAVFALLVALQPAAAADGQEQEMKPSPCCFSNPSYDRICQVQPAPDETCASILAYLNNPLSTGKTYCDNTRVRGGWVQVDCNQAPDQQSAGPAQPSQSR